MPNPKKTEQFQPLTEQHLQDLRDMREVLLGKIKSKGKVGAAGIAMAAKELQRVLDRITAEETRLAFVKKEEALPNASAEAVKAQLAKLDKTRKSGERLA